MKKCKVIALFSNTKRIPKGRQQVSYYAGIYFLVHLSRPQAGQDLSGGPETAFLWLRSFGDSFPAALYKYPFTGSESSVTWRIEGVSRSAWLWTPRYLPGPECSGGRKRFYPGECLQEQQENHSTKGQNPSLWLHQLLSLKSRKRTGTACMPTVKETASILSLKWVCFKCLRLSACLYRRSR